MLCFQDQVDLCRKGFMIHVNEIMSLQMYVCVLYKERPTVNVTKDMNVCFLSF